MTKDKVFEMQGPDTLISEILPIKGGGVQVETPEDLNALVEGPLLKPLKELLSKGIKTIQSSACPTGVWFHLMRDSMNEDNISVALNIGFIPSRIVGSTTIETLFIEYPLTDTTSSQEVEDWACDIVEKFSNQRFRIEE